MTLQSRRILTYEELAQACSEAGFCARRVEFDCAGVPETLRDLIPYAEIWGDNDEENRCAVRKSTPSVLRQHLIDVIYLGEIQDALMAWLLSAENRHPPYTAAYLAFASMNQTISEF